MEEPPAAGAAVIPIEMARFSSERSGKLAAEQFVVDVYAHQRYNAVAAECPLKLGTTGFAASSRPADQSLDRQIEST